MFMLLAALALASCSDSSSNYMTQSQYTLVGEILDFADSAAYAGVTVTDGDTWVTFIDSDGDGELDDDETVIYKETVTNSFSGVDDEDQTYVLEKTYDYEDSYGDSVAGTYSRPFFTAAMRSTGQRMRARKAATRPIPTAVT